MKILLVMDREDAFSAFELLESMERVKKVHIFGFSRGGVMALLTAIRFPEAASWSHGVV